MKGKRTAWGSLAMLLVCLILGAPFALGNHPIRSPWKALAFLAAAAFFAATFLLSLRPRPENNVQSVKVEFTDTTISATYENGERRSVKWTALTKVGITTTDEGPMIEDVFWGLHADEAVKVVYPQGAIGAQELLKAMQSKLAGFDNEAVVHAMGSTRSAHITVWERASDA